MPVEFHDAAAEVYHRISGFKNTKPSPELTAVLQALLSK
jgi:hypothetical protein